MWWFEGLDGPRVQASALQLQQLVLLMMAMLRLLLLILLLLVLLAHCLGGERCHHCQLRLPHDLLQLPQQLQALVHPARPSFCCLPSHPPTCHPCL